MNKKSMSRSSFFKLMVVGLCITGLFSIKGLIVSADSSDKGTSRATSKAFEKESQVFPSRENPRLIVEKGKRVLIYTEVDEMNVHQPNVHWGVVFKDGKFQDRAILRAYSNHLAFHDALLKIGAKPGNNLTKDTMGKHVEGDTLEVKATWPGLGKELSLNEIFVVEKGKGFNIKFGGNRKASEEKNTGCITCLESCWISISSNANDRHRRRLHGLLTWRRLLRGLVRQRKPFAAIGHVLIALAARRFRLRTPTNTASSSSSASPV